MNTDQIIAIMAAIIYAGDGLELTHEDAVEQARKLYTLSKLKPEGR